MADHWSIVRLGEFITERKEFFAIDDWARYKRARVQLHGKDIVLRDEIEGREIKTKQQQAARVGEFLVAEIDAKLGGFGIVPAELAGTVVSSHYFLFEINEQKCLRAWLDWFIRSGLLEEQVNAQGSTNYAAIRPGHVLEYEIPLPPLAEQQRIVARIEAFAQRVEEVRGLKRDVVEETTVLAQSMKSRVFSRNGDTTVKDFATIQSGYAFKSEWFSDDGIRLARNVNIGHGDIRWDNIARIPMERRGEFSAFELREGDILISLDRPLISSGLKAARVRKQDLPSLLLQRVGKVVFTTEAILPDYFFQWLHSPNFTLAIDPGRSNGIPHISQKDIEKIPFSPPSLDEQRRIVAYFDGMEAKVDELRHLQVETQKELNALMPSILGKAFAGEL